MSKSADVQLRTRFAVPADVYRQPAGRGRDHSYCVISKQDHPRPSHHPGAKAIGKRGRAAFGKPSWSVPEDIIFPVRLET